MADQSAFKGWQFTEAADGQDSLVAVYEVIYDDIPTNPYTALVRARAASGDPVPPRRDQYLTQTSWMFAQSFNASLNRSNPSGKVLQWTVTYAPPPVGESPTVYQFSNPLDRPPVYNVQYMDIEEVIDKARNVEALSKGDGNGGNRAANTLGPIVNAAGIRPDEPIMRTKRLEVLVIAKNYPTLASIVSRNRTYKQTTNSDSVEGYDARELRYLLTESQGVQYENGVEFWPGITTILAEDTTDLQLDNVGYQYWDGADLKRAKDSDGQDTAEPINLTLAGADGGTNATTITYRDLEAVAYAPLLN